MSPFPPLAAADSDNIRWLHWSRRYGTLRPTIHVTIILHAPSLWRALSPWCLSKRGRYTVDVLHQGGTGKAWLHIDDETVGAAQHENIFEAYDDKRADNRCPYLLLYCRTALTWTL
jgi:hypothetical protein